jgi:hypothetical protein
MSDSSPFATPSLQLAAAQQPALQTNDAHSSSSSQRPAGHTTPASDGCDTPCTAQLPSAAHDSSLSTSSHALPTHSAAGSDGSDALPAVDTESTSVGSNPSADSVHAPPAMTPSATMTDPILRCRLNDM